MNKELILELRNQAIENVSTKRIDQYGQVQLTWLSDDFDLEFARLLIEQVISAVPRFYNEEDFTELVNAESVIREHFGVYYRE